MSSHTLDKLVYMANQIGREFSAQQPGQAAEATADHLRRYWDPRMRAMIREHVEAGGVGLSEIALRGVSMLGDLSGASP